MLQSFYCHEMVDGWTLWNLGIWHWCSWSGLGSESTFLPHALTGISIFDSCSLRADTCNDPSMQHRRGVRKRRGPTSATEEAKRFTPRHAPSSSSELCDIDPAISAMASSTTDPLHNSLQVVDDVIKASLIDNAVKSLEAESVTEGTYTQLKWTDACEDLRRTYIQEAHPNVCAASNGEFDSTDTLHRSATDRRSPPSSNLTMKRSERSRWLCASTQAFRRCLSAASFSRPTTTSSFPSFCKGSPRGRRIGLQKDARRCRGGRGLSSVSKVGQTSSVRKREVAYTW